MRNAWIMMALPIAVVRATAGCAVEGTVDGADPSETTDADAPDGGWPVSSDESDGPGADGGGGPGGFGGDAAAGGGAGLGEGGAAGGDDAAGGGATNAGGGAPTPPPPPTGPQVCYPGASMNGTACFPTVLKAAGTTGYAYPSNTSLAYTAPTRFLDLSAVPAGAKVAANFSVGELMQEWKGRYAVFQPHVVNKLQAIRAQSGGPLNVNSGFRSPTYNSGVGGATYSRHMYGDAADIWSGVVSLNQIRNLCQAQGADYIGMYSSFVHCDWRYHPADPGFSGLAPDVSSPYQTPAGDPLPAHEPYVFVDESGRWHANTDDFDEGEPYREWSVFDPTGELIEVVAASTFVPPAGAHRVEVMLGGQVAVSIPVADPSRFVRMPADAIEVRLETVAMRMPTFDTVAEPSAP
ncbi:MAG: D-Ala-D-Ala carboxypeptidase family metallohydrolase [Myxococcota bacterium]